MCRYMRYMPLIASREELEKVDEKLRPIIESFYAIPNCATFGASCSGHIEEEEREEKKFYWPKLEGRLNVAILANGNKGLVKELVSSIYDAVTQDKDASLWIWKGIGILGEKERYQGEINEIGDLLAMKIEIGPGDFPYELTLGYLVEEGSSELEKARIRLNEIKRFWNMLGERLKDFCRKYGFNKPNFNKENLEKKLVEALAFKQS